MKKILFICLTLIIVSCSKNEQNNSYLVLLPIDKAITPQNFTFGTTDTIAVKYSLPSGCHYYHSLYHQHQDNVRIIAIRALESLDVSCTQALVQKEVKFPIEILQKEKYIFKFWKGKDNTGKDIFEERIVPVN